MDKAGVVALRAVMRVISTSGTTGLYKNASYFIRSSDILDVKS